MDTSTFESLTGYAVNSSNTALITAQIAKTKLVLESILGYTLTQSQAHDNQYTEIGKLSSLNLCCTYTESNLNDPDAVVTAYRLFPYDRTNEYFLIDPSTAINAVKLVNRGVTYKTFTASEYRPEYRNGIITGLQDCRCSWYCANCCDKLQLAVDADWLWFTGTDLPDDLLQLWADMVEALVSDEYSVKSETLGTHSYTRNTKDAPQNTEFGKMVLAKYAGSNGSYVRKLVV